VYCFSAVLQAFVQAFNSTRYRYHRGTCIAPYIKYWYHRDTLYCWWWQDILICPRWWHLVSLIAPSCPRTYPYVPRNVGVMCPKMYKTVSLCALIRLVMSCQSCHVSNPLSTGYLEFRILRIIAVATWYRVSGILILVYRVPDLNPCVPGTGS
jgi:hypothetical protein